MTVPLQTFHLLYWFLIPGTQAWVKTGFWIALGVTVEAAFSAPVWCQRGRGHGLFRPALLSLGTDYFFNIIEPCDTFRQFITLAFQFHGEVILIIFRFIRTLLTFEQKEADKR